MVTNLGLLHKWKPGVYSAQALLDPPRIQMNCRSSIAFIHRSLKCAEQRALHLEVRGALLRFVHQVDPLLKESTVTFIHLPSVRAWERTILEPSVHIDVKLSLYPLAIRS